MNENQELKHVCKLCNKCFPCGRSLGGHMRSHVINSAEFDEKLAQKKLSRTNNSASNASTETSIEVGGGGQSGYVLREKPQKTCEFADSSDDNLLQSKFCKECGKGFQSWKALFGHMKCHSLRIISNTVEEASWTNNTTNQEQVMDSQPDNETAAPNREKRSRRPKRYMENNTTSSSFSIANASPSVSEIDQEQEKVAMSLIMLSRDVSYMFGLNSVLESSDNNSEFLEARSCTQTPNLITRKISESKNGEFVKFKKPRDGKLESIVLDSGSLKSKEKQHEHSAFKNSRNGIERSKSEIPIDENKIEASEVEHGENASNDLDFNDPKKLTHDALDSVSKSKFECCTCNKTFHSYQALGGHRSSHKKIKGCFASKIDNSENSNGTQVSPETTDDSRLIKSSYINDSPIDHDMVAAGHFGTVQTKKNRVHECPICFKVFPSGQALGGHKRAHLIAEAKASSQTIVVQKPIAEIRDFLDLNLPAPVEEDSSSNVDGFKPWWIESSHKHHEPLVGLLSN